MYYEEKLIGGVMHHRLSPHDPFEPIPLRVLSAKYDRMVARLAELDEMIMMMLKSEGE